MSSNGSRPEHDHDHDYDQHDQNHDHGTSRLQRLRHLLSDAVGGHHHDSEDTIDDAMETHAEGRRVLWISLAVLLVTATLQGVVVAYSGSVALLGDTAHNVADAMTAVPLLIAFRLALRPATDRLTYGYGRGEDLAGIFIVLMIAASSAFALYEAARRLIDPQPVEHLWAVAFAAVIGFIGNELVATWRIRVGRKIGSAALVADGLHARTDGITSLAVLAGAAGVALGFPLADPIVGLLIALAILGILRSAATQVGARLMDAVDPTLVSDVRSALASAHGVDEVGTVRMRWVGHSLYGEAKVVVPAGLTVSAGHEISHAAQAAARASVPRIKEITVHVTPASSESLSAS